MKKVVIAGLLGSVLLTSTLNVAQVCAASVNNSDKGSISVSYTAEKEIAPDVVEISIAIKTEDKKSMQEAVRKNKEVSEKVYSYLKGVINPANGDYLKTSNFSATPQYGYSSGKRFFDKYEVSNSIIVHTKLLNDISQFIDNSLKLGATNVDSLNFSLSEKDAQCSELLVKATQKAKERANIVAGAIGSNVVGIKNIETSCSVNMPRSNYYIQRAYMNSVEASGAMNDSSSNSPIEAGVIRIYSNVNANFYVK